MIEKQGYDGIPLLFLFNRFIYLIITMLQTYYKNNDQFLVAVDCIIFGFSKKDLHVLLTRRPVEPLKNKWSLMGGFMEADESLSKAAEKVL